MVFLIVSIVIISIIGTLAHFLYDLTNHNKFIGIFAAVNESTWEHIKIAMTPTLLWGLIDGFIYAQIRIISSPKRRACLRLLC
ncbi:hypothetical protein IJH02_03820 [Candidatus Saccharibacteria bacterium]|nr:hypothetical protein [Candidatus Saccharibacteria bacterium]